MQLFDYHLPPERIAQWPVSLNGERSDSRLLVAESGSGKVKLEDRRVSELAGFFRPGDCLVINNTRVKPARYFIEPDHECPVAGEIFLLGKDSDDTYVALAKPMKRLASCRRIPIAPGVSAIPSGRDGSRLKLRMELSACDSGSSEQRMSISSEIEQRLSVAGGVPIPPYIRGGRSEAKDAELYQTIYARHDGSVAAPTAGLHFTANLLNQIRSVGVNIVEITLHVGTASFHAAHKQDPNLERLDAEQYFIEQSVFQQLIESKCAGARVTAVGTTTTRALESYALIPEGIRTKMPRSTELCIKPGFKFQVVDRLFTNFHQPGSTHLMLVTAFAGYDAIRSAYEHALERQYRFLSYGDAMLLDLKIDPSKRSPKPTDSVLS